MIPNPYVLLAAAGLWIASLVGAFFYGEHIDALSYKAALGKQEADAATLLAQLNATAAKKDADNAQAARDLDAAHHDKEQAIADSGADFNKRLASAVLDAQRRARSQCKLPSTAAAPSQPQNPPAGSDSGPGSVDPGAVRKLRDIALKLQEDVRFCWAEAAKIGR